MSCMNDPIGEWLAVHGTYVQTSESAVSKIGASVKGSAVKTTTVSKEAWDAIVQTVLLAGNPGRAGSS